MTGTGIEARTSDVKKSILPHETPTLMKIKLIADNHQVGWSIIYSFISDILNDQLDEPRDYITQLQIIIETRFINVEIK